MSETETSETSSLMDDTEVTGYPSRETSPGKAAYPANAEGDSVGKPRDGNDFFSATLLDYEGFGIQVAAGNEENVGQGDGNFQSGITRGGTVENAIDGRETTYCEPSFYILAVDPSLIAEAATIDDEEEGSLSPPSSQGSLSSMDFLDRNVQRIKKKTTNFQMAMRSPGLDFSKRQHDLLGKFIKDKAFKSRFRTFMKNEYKSYLSASGEKDKDPSTCNDLLNTIKNEDSSTLFARVGKIFVENHCKKGRSQSESAGNADAETDKSHEPETISSDIKLEPPFNNAYTVDSFPSPFKQNVGSIELMDETPSTSRTSSVSQHLKDVAPTVYRFGKTEDELDRLIEKANDCIRDNEKDKCKQITCAGQVLFKEIFTELDIRECTLSGKKTKTLKGKTRSYPEEEVRFLNQSIFWLLTRPGTRGIRAFERFVVEKDERLSREDNETLKRRVFTEYAYSLRNKLVSNEGAKTEGDGSRKHAKRQKRQ